MGHARCAPRGRYRCGRVTLNERGSPFPWTLPVIRTGPDCCLCISRRDGAVLRATAARGGCGGVPGVLWGPLAGVRGVRRFLQWPVGLTRPVGAPGALRALLTAVGRGAGSRRRRQQVHAAGVRALAAGACDGQAGLSRAAACQAWTWPTRKAIIATRARQNRTRVARMSNVMSRISYKGDDTATGRGGRPSSPHRVAVAGCASLSLTT